MIFIGALFPKDRETEIIENTPSRAIQNQANNYEWSLLEGFRANGVEHKIINVLPVGTFPRGYRQLILKDADWGENGENHEVGSVNLPIMKQSGRYRRIKRLLKKSEDTDIVVYSAYLPFLKAVSRLDKRYRITLIVTDLPEYYDLKKTSRLKSFLRKVNNKRIYRYLGRIDQYVLLTDEMKYPLKVGDKPYVVVEGIANGLFRREDAEPTDKFIAVYAGTMNFRFGIKNLIDAFCLIENKSIELHLFGSGEAIPYVRQAAAEHTNVVYHGFVSKQELTEFYKKTDLLINPRMNDGEYTKYSFPSKTMEYLASGIPVAAYKLGGVPDEYDAYLNYPADDSAGALAEKIVEISGDKTGKFAQKAHEGQLFVENRKNPSVQVKKIVDMWNGGVCTGQ
ncbi:MAG: glycosyltransferase [Clostridia bacterium]|nr:glycosyltransferase [Clostridia bacterium]